MLEYFRPIASLFRLPAFIFLYLLSFSYDNILSAQVQQEWVRLYPDTNTFSANANALALDDSGNVYITGTAGAYSFVAYSTIKYSGSGSRMWAAFYYGSNYGGRQAKSIAVDKFSNVYVTGYSNNQASLFDYCTVKYDSRGTELWVRYYDGPAHGYDEAEKIAVDNAGNVYASGFSGSVFTTIKYSEDGRELWVRSYGNGVPVPHVKDIEVDENSNLYITGYYNGAATVKYDSSGNQLWSAVYGSGMAGSNSLALDADLNVYITGYIRGIISEYDYFTSKYSTSGIQQWVRKYSIDSTQPFSQNAANSIAVDDASNVYVSGYTLNMPYRRFCTIKYSSSGDFIWLNLDTSNLWEQSTYMVMDKNNNIYISGTTENLPSDADITTIKYDSSGKQQWRQKYSVFGISRPSSIIIDSQFNIILTGQSNTKMCTIKYSQIVGIVNINSEIPEEYKLYQNYPNPFNPVTKIKFDIPRINAQRTSNVKLSVHDILGREIALLVDEELNPGIYEVEWDASSFSSGVYFFRMISGQYNESRRMILIK